MRLGQIGKSDWVAHWDGQGTLTRRRVTRVTAWRVYLGEEAFARPSGKALLSRWGEERRIEPWHDDLVRELNSQAEKRWKEQLKLSAVEMINDRRLSSKALQNVIAEIRRNLT